MHIQMTQNTAGMKYARKSTEKHRSGNIALPAAVGSYDDSHAVRKFYGSFISKGLESLQCQTQ